MNDLAAVLEHVDLVDALDALDAELLERALQLFVVGRSGLVNDLLLSSWHTLENLELEIRKDLQ
jgi:hypothetical protein